MRIQVPGTKTSDRLMLAATAERLGIPETDAGLKKVAATKRAAACCECPDGQCKCGCTGLKHAVTKTPCPECEAPLLKSAEMERCAVCGYAQATEEKKEQVKVAAADKGILEYYKQIYPDDYAKELVDESPGKMLAGGKKEYGKVKGATIRVSAREVLA